MCIIPKETLLKENGLSFATLPSTNKVLGC